MAQRPNVQFDLADEDLQDLDSLVGEIKSRAAVARVLLLFGLTHSDQALAWYALPHAKKRQRRLANAEEAITPPDS